MGLQCITEGITPTEDDTNVVVNDIVRRVNSTVLAHVGIRSSTIEENSDILVCHLGRILGLYAMQRILLCLLYYIEENQKEDDIESPIPPTIWERILLARTRRQKMKQLAIIDEFTIVIERYINKMEYNEGSISSTYNILVSAHIENISSLNRFSHIDTSPPSSGMLKHPKTGATVEEAVAKAMTRT